VALLKKVGLMLAVKGGCFSEKYIAFSGLFAINIRYSGIFFVGEASLCGYVWVVLAGWLLVLERMVWSVLYRHYVPLYCYFTPC
jgi:hypothetical protein